MTQTTTKSPSIEVFDPAMCCSTGVCGTDVDQTLLSFAADAAWVSAQGARLVRHNLAQEPLAFVQNTLVAAVLKVTGEKALPLVLLNGEVALSGRYPTRDELTQWLGGEALPELTIAPSGGCGCGGDNC